MHMVRKIITLCLASLVTLTGISQQLTYEQYMQRVLNNNTALVAHSLDIEIAQAHVKSSKIHGDPTLSLEYGNNQDWDKDLGQSIAAQLSRTFTFGVRKSGIRLAHKELQATTAVFNDFLRNFQAEATIAYLEHLRAKSLWATAVKRQEYMRQLAHNDSIRYQRGDIAKSVWIESRLAAGLTHNERLEREAQLNNTAIVLGYYMGDMQNADSIKAAGNLQETAIELAPLDYYIEQAMANRADLNAAISNVDIAKARQKLNSARRRIDIQLSIGAEYNKSNPSFTKLKIGAAVPLKFSNLNNGARAMDIASVEQAQKQLTDTRLGIHSEVMQAYNNCRIADRQAATFTRDMLQETASLLESKREAYRQGEISFVEYIETERSDNMLQEEYINALFNSAASRVRLLQSIGLNTEENTTAISYTRHTRP